VLSVLIDYYLFHNHKMKQKEQNIITGFERYLLEHIQF